MIRLASLALIMAVAAACSQAAPKPTGLSDGAMQAVMAGNITRLGNPAVHQNADGSPDIAVSSGVLIVTTLDPGTAASLCRSVAAITNDPDTAKPLGIIGVTIISGGKSVATCRP